MGSVRDLAPSGGSLWQHMTLFCFSSKRGLIKTEREDMKIPKKKKKRYENSKEKTPDVKIYNHNNINYPSVSPSSIYTAVIKVLRELTLLP